MASIDDTKRITEHFPSNSNESAEGIEADAMVVVWLVLLADDLLKTGENDAGVEDTVGLVRQLSARWLHVLAVSSSHHHISIPSASSVLC
jgi:hypothetical protein